MELEIIAQSLIFSGASFELVWLLKKTKHDGSRASTVISILACMQCSEKCTEFNKGVKPLIEVLINPSLPQHQAQ